MSLRSKFCLKHGLRLARISRVFPTLNSPVASNRHFAVFAVICAGFTILGIWGQLQSHGGSLDASHTGIIPLYVSTIVGEWFLLLFVWRGMRSAGNDPLALVGHRASSISIIRDIAIGIVFGIVLLYVDAGITSFFSSNSAASVDALLPRGAIEIALWVVVSFTAGITEEIVYRGYLFAQLTSRLRNVPAAIVAQALWFATMHAYEGLHSVLSISVLALAFGLMAVWRRQLRTNIAAHAVIDLIGGIAPRLIHF